MRSKFGKFSLSLILLLSMQTLFLYVPMGVSSQDDTGTPSAQTIDLAKWGISNDGSHPVETTKGINEALVWANQNGITATTLPSGTYLIDKNSRINMVSDMLLELPSDTILQKERNGKERYELMYLGYGIKNVTLRGGTYMGDRENHDYSKKDSPYSAGTHESGYGIILEGASNIVIEGVKAVNFTGDGLVIGGFGTMVKDLYEGGLISGTLNEMGKPTKNTAKIRTKKAITLSNPIFKTEHFFELSNMMKIKTAFEVYFYAANGTFMKKVQAKIREHIAIPNGASSFHLVFNQTSAKGAYLEIWNRVVSEKIDVKNSEFAFNRRQGITVGGANNVSIDGNMIHDIKGVAPQSGIDVEGGYGENGHLNTNIFIRNNEFYNNAIYDVILYDGHTATVEGNHMASKGAYGLAISETFKDAMVVNNHFDVSRIIAYHDATFLNNRLNDAGTYFEGPNLTIDGMEVTNGLFSVSSKKPFGIKVSNVNINITKKVDAGLSISNQPIQLSNVTITGEPSLRSFAGTVATGSIFDNLKVIGYNSTYGLSLPPGTYNNSWFEGAEGGKFGTVSGSLGGKYVFDGCTFTTDTTGAGVLFAENKNMELTIKDSTFNILGNTQAISVQAAKSVVIENNIINAKKLTSSGIEIIKINDYWKRNEPFDVLSVVIRGNTITSNLPANGISTQYAGKGAVPFIVKNNTLYKAKLALKANDKAGNNVMR
ncbi:right-handed parallel beta-helix repeat-containing protein [Paenibacillus sp. BR2-3]|uniref:right-handed parallel beta-helix repeat-containing protein n=1 Tax=Paenibacillus sp. BR2-3 TaxID=3048494 RepID=UPI0039774505